MSRRFRLGDVIFERFQIIFAVESKRAQPAECVRFKASLRILFAITFEYLRGFFADGRAPFRFLFRPTVHRLDPTA